MRIKILDEAKKDLVDGFRFYEERSPGLGSYFLDSLFADIDSMLLYAGTTASFTARIVALPAASPLRSTTVWMAMLFVFTQ